VQSSYSPALGPFDYVLFVHGYNNSHEEARVGYARFRWWLEQHGANPRVLEFHWPGDSVPLLGWASYWRQVRGAKKCGALLARWIERDTPRFSRFILVGHSMGCRLILEMLETLDPKVRRERIEGICLMAAAVPVNAIENRELGPRTDDNARWRILYSGGDYVLMLAFRAGQPAAGDSIVSKAVGFCGEPKYRWRLQDDCEELCEHWNNKAHRYGHSWYWRSGSKAGEVASVPGPDALPPAESPVRSQGRSAKIVAELLGTIVERRLRSRPSAFDRSISDNRTIRDRSVGDQ
jgi:pimeloyl-ACP methyl ester carboxylesterase